MGTLVQVPVYEGNTLPREREIEKETQLISL